VAPGQREGGDRGERRGGLADHAIFARPVVGRARAPWWIEPRIPEAPGQAMRVFQADVSGYALVLAQTSAWPGKGVDPRAGRTLTLSGDEPRAVSGLLCRR
jgi:hypothetical protein